MESLIQSYQLPRLNVMAFLWPAIIWRRSNVRTTTASGGLGQYTCFEIGTSVPFSSP